MLTPTEDRFRALARSSPWRWGALRFTASWPHPDTALWPRPVRGCVRRPDGLRVTELDGTLVLAHREEDPRRTGWLQRAGGRPEPMTSPLPGDPGAPAPVVGADGLVRERPVETALRYDDPMFQGYLWVAVLDPVELADGEGRRTGDPIEAPLVLDDLAAGASRGRPWWEAVVRTTDAYDPRCSCCSLLRTREIDELEHASGGAPRRPGPYPEAHRVRLDVGTGVCTLTEEIGGARPGVRHTLDIEAVDEPMADALFTG